MGLAILLTSCATGPPRPAGFEVYDSVAVMVTTAVPEGEEWTAALRDSIIEALQEQQVFRSVHAAADGGVADGLLVEASITRLRKVPDVERIALGEMARGNEVVADIAIRDARSRQALSSFRLQGESPEYPPARHEFLRMAAGWKR